MKLLRAAIGWARNFRLDRSSDPYVQYLREVAASPAIVAVRDQALERLNLHSGDQVADIGCGPGTMTIQIASRIGPTGCAHGVDSNPEMIAAANELAARSQQSPYIQLHLGDCMDLPFEDNRFDACYCERVFQHLADGGPVRAAREILRILKPGGRFAVVDTDWLSLTIPVCESSLARRVVQAWANKLPTPDAGIRLTEWLSGVGGAEPTVESNTLYLLPHGPTAELLNTAAAESLNPLELVEWSTSIAAAGHNHVPLGSVRMLTVSGRKS